MTGVEQRAVRRCDRRSSALENGRGTKPSRWRPPSDCCALRPVQPEVVEDHGEEAAEGLNPCRASSGSLVVCPDGGVAERGRARRRRRRAGRARARSAQARAACARGGPVLEVLEPAGCSKPASGSRRARRARQHCARAACRASGPSLPLRLTVIVVLLWRSVRRRRPGGRSCPAAVLRGGLLVEGLDEDALERRIRSTSSARRQAASRRAGE